MLPLQEVTPYIEYRGMNSSVRGYQLLDGPILSMNHWYFVICILIRTWISSAWNEYRGYRVFVQIQGICTPWVCRNRFWFTKVHIDTNWLIFKCHHILPLPPFFLFASVLGQTHLLLWITGYNNLIMLFNTIWYNTITGCFLMIDVFYDGWLLENNF